MKSSSTIGRTTEAAAASREGGCLCGALRYRVTRGAELCVYCCHCRDCQRLTSSAFALAMVVPAADFTLLEGEPGRIRRRADSGREVEGCFCSRCGSRLFDSFPEFPDILIVRIGGLDDPSGLRPVAQFWTARKQDWVVLPQDQLVDARQPDGFAAVIALYQARQAAGEASSEAGSDAGGGPES